MLPGKHKYIKPVVLSPMVHCACPGRYQPVRDVDEGHRHEMERFLGKLIEVFIYEREISCAYAHNRFGNLSFLPHHQTTDNSKGLDCGNILEAGNA